MHTSTQPSLSKSPQAATPPLLPLRPIASVTSTNGLIAAPASREAGSIIQKATKANRPTQDRMDMKNSLQSGHPPLQSGGAGRKEKPSARPLPAQRLRLVESEAGCSRTLRGSGTGP